MQTHAIIVSAGKGLRMNRSTPKQYLLLQGRPVLCHTIMAFNRCPEWMRFSWWFRKMISPIAGSNFFQVCALDTPVKVLAGGKRRQDSVFNGILSIDDADGIVVIHDGVRPLIQPEMISRCIDNAKLSGACILGVPLQDTLKMVDSDGMDTKNGQQGGSVGCSDTPGVSLPAHSGCP